MAYLASVDLPTYQATVELYMVVATNLHMGLGIVRGDSFPLRRTLPGVPPSVTVSSAKLTVKLAIADASPGLFQLTATVEDTGTSGIGVIRFDFSSANTLLMVQDQPYFFDIQVTLSNANVLTPEYGITSSTYEVTS